MSWFGHDHEELLTELRRKFPEDGALVQERSALERQVNELRRELTAKEITASKKQEDFDKRERELRHMIGLEQKRQAFELEASKRDALLSVREENLVKDRQRFEQQMTFQTERFEKELAAERALMQQILERLPTITVDKRVEESSHVGGPRRK
jgi:hypothetical protein